MVFQCRNGDIELVRGKIRHLSIIAVSVGTLLRVVNSRHGEHLQYECLNIVIVTGDAEGLRAARAAEAREAIQVALCVSICRRSETKRSIYPREIMSTAQAKPVMHFIERLQQAGGLKGTDIANMAGVSKSTVSRWVSGRKSPHPDTQLKISDLSYVVMRLSEFYPREEVRAWLYARHPQLEGERAMDLIFGDRTEEIIAILDRLDADAYL